MKPSGMTIKLKGENHEIGKLKDVSTEFNKHQSIGFEIKLRTDILNAFKEVIAFYTPDHKILWLNEAGKKQLNFKNEDYKGKLCYKVWFKNKKPCVTCPVVHNKFETTERVVTFADGSIWKIRHTPLYDDTSTLMGYIEFREDITEKELIKAEILDEREKYKMLAENAPFGLILTRNNKAEYINKTCMEWLGIKAISEFDQVGIMHAFTIHDRKLAEIISKKIRDNDIPEPVVEKLKVVNKNGSIQYLRFEIKNNLINGRSYVQTVIVDITNDVLKEKKQKQVAADALYINQKNTILNEIESVLGKTLAQADLAKHKDEFKRIYHIINSYKQLDRDWKMLIANFEEVHPGFFKKLTDTFPALSPNDIKHCACIKMNFDTKEIARFFNVKNSSVQISRVRLKKKMNLSDSIDLRNFILNF